MRPVVLLVLAFAFAFATGVEASVSAATLRVPADYPTIQSAINAAANGDTIEIAPGTYAENLFVEEKGVTLVGTGGAAATIVRRGGANRPILARGFAFQQTPTVVRGLTLAGGDAPYGAGILAYGIAPLVVTDCVFDDNHSEVGYFGAAILGWSIPVTVERCRFTNNDQRGDTQYTAGVIGLVNGASATIRNNVFWHNDTRAINLDSVSIPTVVENNTFVANDAAFYVGPGPTGPDVVFRNNIIASNDFGVETYRDYSYTLTVFENNLVYGNGTDFYNVAVNPIGTSGNIAAPPGFVSEAAGDFHLVPTSAALDAGTSVGAPPDDFDRLTRPIDGNGDGVARVDIGAYEGGPRLAYDIVIQDDRTGDTLRFASGSGAWIFSRCGAAAVTLQGTGRVRRADSCSIQLVAQGPTSVNATYNTCRHTGTATVQSSASSVSARLTDSNTANSTGACRN